MIRATSIFCFGVSPISLVKAPLSQGAAAPTSVPSYRLISGEALQADLNAQETPPGVSRKFHGSNRELSPV
jgi:hypothetical protein